MEWHNKVYVFDDIVDLDTQNKIKDKMLNEASWSYVSDVTNPHLNEQQRPGFAHWFVKDEIVRSYLHEVHLTSLCYLYLMVVVKKNDLVNIFFHHTLAFF